MTTVQRDHQARVAVDGAGYRVGCSCGWVSRDWRTHQLALAAHARHVPADDAATATTITLNDEERALLVSALTRERALGNRSRADALLDRLRAPERLAASHDERMTSFRGRRDNQR